MSVIMQLKLEKIIVMFIKFEEGGKINREFFSIRYVFEPV